LKPYEVDHRAEASLPPSVRSALRENVREWSGSHGFDFELLGFHFAGAPEADVRAGLAVLEAIDRPCPLPIAEKAIATLRVRTKARAGDAADTALMLAIFSEDVGDYPPDVVVDGCKGWARSEKWFPGPEVKSTSTAGEAPPADGRGLRATSGRGGGAAMRAPRKPPS